MMDAWPVATPAELRPDFLDLHDMPTTYQYSVLTGNERFQLLYLHHRKRSGRISCRIVHTSLDDHPPYEAISYEWKKHEGVVEISCKSSTIEITSSLSSALDVLRLPDTERVLWADAACINQEDDIEKGAQIPMMRDIYVEAKSVVVWLSKAGIHTSAAFRLLPLLAFLWVERQSKGLHPENMIPFMLRQRPKGSVFISKDDKFWCSPAKGYNEQSIRLSRPRGCSDDEIFTFHNDELWITLDDLFGSSYFQRSWIQQEIAVAHSVYFTCGQDEVPFDIFSAAYGARNLLLFQPIRFSNSNYSIAPFSCVRDCRNRYRNPEFRSDLAAVLATFNYSKQTRNHDHIYAALGLVKDPSIYNKINPNYTKSVETVFIEAATYIIEDRQDLYLWGSKSLYTTRTMKGLPSWVPEWTGPSCEEAIGYYRKDSGRNYFCRLLQGNYLIQGHLLYVNGYILDRIELVTPVCTDEQIMDLVARLESYFNQRDSGLFDQYRGSVWEKHVPLSLTSTQVSELWLENMVDAFWILLTFKHAPDLLIATLSELFTSNLHSLNGSRLNIEALWSVLTPKPPIRPPPPIDLTHPCERLFLATLFLMSLIKAYPKEASVGGGRPKTFDVWITAATILYGIDSTSLGELYVNHCFRSNIGDEEYFFVTKTGYFGRAPLQVMDKEHFVAILGGTYIPYILEKHDNHYVLFSHAFVEGIMDWKDVPCHFRVQRIELR